MTGRAGERIEVPEALVSWHRKFFGESGRAWIDAAPDLAAGLLDRWQLRPDGAAACGAVALVLPVLRADATPAVLKLQPVTESNVGEPDALRAWNGNGAVRLLDHDPESGSMLLERLNADRTLATVTDDLAALQILSELLARLSAVPAPAGLRRLSDFAADLLDRVPRALTLARDPSQPSLIQAAGLNGTAAVIRDPEVLEPEFLRAGCHFLQGIASITRGCMAMKSATQVFCFDQSGESAGRGRLKFAAVLA